MLTGELACVAEEIEDDLGFECFDILPARPGRTLARPRVRRFTCG
jgi:hypothetical protein